MLAAGWQRACTGGIGEYVSWARSSGEYLQSKEDFFSSPVCRQLYRNYATTLLSRVNTITGVPYRDDPTIFAWELINEPRVPQDWSGDTLQSWIAEVSAHIKSIDPAHLLTTGVEVRIAWLGFENRGRADGFWQGFFGPSTPELVSNNPYSGSEGTDFHRNHDLDTIDFTVAHGVLMRTWRCCAVWLATPRAAVWADQWKRNSGCDQRCLLAFIQQWHVSHLAASTQLGACSGLARPAWLHLMPLHPAGKPFILEEFGAPRWWRDELYANTYDLTYGAAINGEAVGGDMLWLLAGSSSVPDYDTYTVYPGDTSTLALVTNQVQRMRQLDADCTPLPPPPLQASPPYWQGLVAPYPGMPPMPPSPPVPAAYADESSWALRECETHYLNIK